ncbi:response regulator transcription factor [Allostreptomyces psammosilenae]|uniref:DNA-binding response OmpR family regulator n=1 Tax=Allostreptomyces psammosilenae TaxID=1892865 RepID=A0A852ZZH0_9ACTN|nr:DNA-binding response regulator [Allostreptomyces psammosilenae]NYI03518.1 DNA-binding response OmpR family regulator [Allostreptomyces psammosilenae]
MYGSTSDRPLPPRGEAPRVLVVVEDPGAVDLLTATLQLAGYRVEVAATGTGALTARSGGPSAGGRPGPGDGGRRYDDLVIDDAACQARRGRRALDLTPAEYRLLRQMLLHAERVLSKEQISRSVWGESRADNAIEKLVSRLRRKVDRDGPPLIHNRRGFGYWLGRSARPDA